MTYALMPSALALCGSYTSLGFLGYLCNCDEKKQWYSVEKPSCGESKAAVALLFEASRLRR